MGIKIISSQELPQAAQMLLDGDVVAFPTETVYGLGSLVFDEKAVSKIFIMKRRPADNPLIVHIAKLEQIHQLAIDIPKEFYLLADKFFPGPLSLVLKKNSNVPNNVCAGLDSVAIRMPAHDMARRLIELAGSPIAAPSANLSGKPSATRLEHVLEDFGDVLKGVVDGGDSVLGLESTVISLINPEDPILLRPGSITKEDLESVLGREIRYAKATEPARSPGMKYRHYAPIAKVKLFFEKAAFDDYIVNKTVLGCQNVTPHNLYACLRHADQLKYAEVAFFCDETCLQDEALMDRLTKAENK